MLEAVIGGALIGGAASLMLLFNGRVAGVSGIVGGALTPVKGDFAWRGSFVLGLLAGGGLLLLIRPESLAAGDPVTSLSGHAAAGLLVGFGTLLGSGCTSGHGVCGVSRLSPRSLAATGIFIFTGILSVAFLKLTGIGV